MNEHRDAARARKAAALISAARRLHVTSERIATSEVTRGQLVDLAAVNEPSLATWAIVVETVARLEADEAAQAGDPFAGL